MAHILIVCTANICRSPVVAALLKERLAENGRSHWQISSAGTWAKIVRGPSRYSRKLMAEQGLDISSHRAHMITEADLKAADLVLCMETGHQEALRAEFPSYAAKIHLFSTLTGRRYSISDPYGGVEDDYRRMVAEVTRILDAGLEKLIQLAEQPQP